MADPSLVGRLLGMGLTLLALLALCAGGATASYARGHAPKAAKRSHKRCKARAARSRKSSRPCPRRAARAKKRSAAGFPKERATVVRSAAAPPARAPVTPPPTSSAVPGGRKPLFGFNDNSVLAGQISATQDADLNARAGANVVRATFDWRWAEPVKGQYRLGVYDDIYKASIARGVRPVFIVLFAPSWALDPSTPCNQWATDCKLPPGRAHDADLAAVAAMLAKRYPQSAAIEIWNEPNQRVFWTSGPDPARYTEMLRASYRAVKAAAPGMTVLGASLSDNPSARDGTPPEPYLQAMYKAGARGSMDGISFHPYPHAAGLLDRTFASVRRVRHDFGDDSTPLWVTETGWTTSGGSSGTWPAAWIRTEQQQATDLVTLYRKLAAMPDVAGVMVHTLVEPRGDAASSPGVGYGIVRANLQLKPAFCALAAERGRRC